MDREYMRGDGRNPYGSRGGYVVSSKGGRGRGRGRGRRGDRGMPYPETDMRYGSSRGDMRSYPDYLGEDYRVDMRYEDMRGGDMHYGGGRGGYEPVEFMGYCSGYYGEPQDRGRGMDYGRMDYGRGRDYGYHDYGGDYGTTLTEKELDEWCKKLKEQLDEREKQMFSKDAIMQKARQMGKSMEGFGEKELEVAVLMVYTDYKHTIGQNVDTAIKLAFDWLLDKDASVRGAEKLAVYYDCIVVDEE